jgi:hypothetical protein
MLDLENREAVNLRPVRKVKPTASGGAPTIEYSGIKTERGRSLHRLIGWHRVRLLWRFFGQLQYGLPQAPMFVEKRDEVGLAASPLRPGDLHECTFLLRSPAGDTW